MKCFRCWLHTGELIEIRPPHVDDVFGRPQCPQCGIVPGAMEKYRCRARGRVHWFLPQDGCRDCGGKMAPINQRRNRKDAGDKSEAK